MQTKIDMKTVVVCLGVAMLASTGFAQSQTFRSSSDLVVLQVAVHDRRGSPVDRLTAAEFRVWEDQTPQKILFFLSESRPAAIGLIVDNSTSMQPRRREVIAAAEAFARSGHPQDQLFLVNFNELVTFGLPEETRFTSDLGALRKALGTIGARGQTAIYDGVVTGLDRLNDSPLDQKVLVVVSDGEDNRSRMTFDDVLVRSLRSHAVIYTVGIIDPLGGGDRKMLKRLADSTGGMVFFPERDRQISEALGQIAVDIRHRYTIGYVSTNRRRDGTARHLRVEAVDRETGTPLQVKARQGYIAQ